jgi:hypothetical protein
MSFRRRARPSHVGQRRALGSHASPTSERHDELTFFRSSRQKPLGMSNPVLHLFLIGKQAARRGEQGGMDKVSERGDMDETRLTTAFGRARKGRQRAIPLRTNFFGFSRA